MENILIMVHYLPNSLKKRSMNKKSQNPTAK